MSAWQEWNGVAVSEERRNAWAAEIAAGKAFSFCSGDSIVFGDVDSTNGERSIVITDARIRRDMRVPVPAGSPVDKADLLRRDAPEQQAKIDALADALERLLAMLASDAINIECAYRADAEILHERENAARLALRKAGRP